jgi:tetratricopeptide (TPR) repeat protein
VDRSSQILERLGLRQDAISIVSQRLATAESSELLNLRLLELLMAEQDWSGLRDLSRQLGTQRRNSDFLGALAMFAEELMPTEDPPLSLASVEAIGSQLSSAGAVSPAIRFLSGLERHRLGMVAAQLAGACETVLSDAASYWELRQRLAIAAKNTFELQYAAKRTLELDPSSVNARADLGFALLVQRRDAPTVLKDSETALNDFPTNAALRINLGSALAQLRRWQESLEALNLAPRDALTAERKGLASLANIEALAGLGRKQEARVLLKEIDRKALFPEQTRWLDQILVDGVVAATVGR